MNESQTQILRLIKTRIMQRSATIVCVGEVAVIKIFDDDNPTTGQRAHEYMTYCETPIRTFQLKVTKTY